jgi:streptogramin lyase
MPALHRLESRPVPPRFNEGPVPALGRGRLFRDQPPVMIGPDGSLWFTDPDAGVIRRITPDGSITEFPFPTTL